MAICKKPIISLPVSALGSVNFCAKSKMCMRLSGGEFEDYMCGFHNHNIEGHGQSDFRS